MKHSHLNRRRRGNAILETALVFVPLAFMILGSFELGRGMWIYHSFTSALKSGTRYAMVHGANCLEADTSCAATVSAVSAVIRQYGIGLDSTNLQLTLVAGGSSYACGTLAACVSDSTQWPPSTGNQPGSEITIQGAYTFQSVLASFWPGQGAALKTYSASSTDAVEF